MATADLLISLRERLLEIVSGSDRAQTLNQTPASDEDLFDGGPATELIDFLHEVLSSELVDHGETVDYSALCASLLYDDSHHCTAKLRTFDPSALITRQAQLAFWINLYNTLVLDGVITLGIQRSIMEQRAGLTFLRQAAHIIGGQRMSCDDNGILGANRGHPLFPGNQFGSADPRLKWVIKPFDVGIHFALNCASRSCPLIRAYTPEKLDAQWDLATRSYLATDIQILPEKDAVRLSSTFKWFAKDFGGRHDIIDFILLHHSDTTERTCLMHQRSRVSLRYKPYNWSLNGKACRF